MSKSITLLQRLKNRGFIDQITDPKIENILETNKVTAYIGFDPTSDSLHIGSLVPLMLLKWLELYNHNPIALIGCGTAMVGDPTGKTELRKMISKEAIFKNADGIIKNFKQFLAIGEKTKISNNYDWLGNLNYIEFLRDIGAYFSVNRMLTAEAYKIRLEKGLSFIEFNYQIVQAYDFLKLYEREKCTFQFGGSDQWGNIVAGIDLIRRVHQKETYACTAPLFMSSSGEKMGKSAGNAVWLAADKLKPYDYYQYWINIDDKDIKRFLLLFTLLPEEYIEDICLKEQNPNELKRLLAYEATKLCHGEEEADKAKKGAAIFSGVKDDSSLENIPSIEIRKSEINNIDTIDLFMKAGLASSRSEARRLIEQGGAYIDDQQVKSFKDKILLENIKNSFIILRVGKKKYKRLILK